MLQALSDIFRCMVGRLGQLTSVAAISTSFSVVHTGQPTIIDSISDGTLA